MDRSRGRPQCKKLCCTSNIFIVQRYIDFKESANEIAKILGVSPPHISQRLKQLGVKMRRRIDYPSSGRGVRRSPLWKLSDEELFGQPMGLLMKTYGVGKGVVYDIRKKRRKR